MKKYSVLVLCIIVTLGVIQRVYRPVTINQPSGILNAFTPPTPTPVPFVEMTIPYLRQRSYTSTLNARTIAYEKFAYTAYLTSYDSDGLKNDTPRGRAIGVSKP